MNVLYVPIHLRSCGILKNKKYRYWWIFGGQSVFTKMRIHQNPPERKYRDNKIRRIRWIFLVDFLTEICALSWNFTRGPVIRVKKIPGNRGGFCQLDFRGSCFHRNRIWILNQNGQHLTENYNLGSGTMILKKNQNLRKKKYRRGCGNYNIFYA